jgi:uncharacterized protein
VKIAVVGASKNRDKYGNKAVRAYKSQDHVVFPVNPTEREIEGLKCYSDISQVPLDLDIVSVYLPPEVGIKVLPSIIRKKVKRIILNPGSESKDMIRLLKKSKQDFTMTCSIKEIGLDPEKI